MQNNSEQKITRPTYVEINLNNITHNFKQIRQHIPGQKIMCIVKGNAYGHGIVKTSQHLEKIGADYLGVAIPEEGIALRKAGIKIPILVLSAIIDRQIPLCLKHNLTITAPSDEKLLAINKAAKGLGLQARVHLKIDTGMGRIGVHHGRIQKYTSIMPDCKYCEFEGIYSHFARSGENHEFNQIQKENFTKAIEEFKAAGFDFPLVHLANSGGILFHADSQHTMVRTGMLLYGYCKNPTLPKSFKSKKAMTWKTEVSYFKSIPENTGIGYGHNYISKSKTRIITLPVGYADGYQRSIGPKGKILLHNALHPLAGTICMDQMMIDIGEQGVAYSGDSVILVGESENHKIDFKDLSDWSGLGIYELMTQISNRVPRIYIE